MLIPHFTKIDLKNLIKVIKGHLASVETRILGKGKECLSLWPDFVIS